MAMVTAVGAISCLASSCMMNHLGRKPVSGGSPARDSRTSIKEAFSTGVFVQEIINVESFMALILFKVRNTVVVMTVYR